MKLKPTTSQSDERLTGRLSDSALVVAKRRQGGSVLILVLWMALGLVTIALYFANSMSYELRASENRVSGLGAEQAIEGAARYVKEVLIAYATNGAVPLNTEFSCEEVPVGDSTFWIIGRDTSGTVPTKPYFGLIDEASKLNLNTVNSNALSYLPNMTTEIADAITDWRDTNGTISLGNAVMNYSPKHGEFETVDEVRMVDGVTLSLLDGADVNHNGILDSNERNTSGASTDEGLLEDVTVYSREPNFMPDGTTLTNANAPGELFPLLEEVFGTSRARQTTNSLGGATLTGPLDFYYRANGGGNVLTLDEFEEIYDLMTFSTNMYTYGRVNVNTASQAVLTALFYGISSDENTAVSAAQTLVDYRAQSTDRLSTVGWIMDALGRDHPLIAQLRQGDYITTRSYQFTADIAATGPMGRGYRRVKFVFDTSDGAPKIIYRQDLSRLGWALGDTVRETLLAKENQ